MTTITTANTQGKNQHR